jgi:hypothetical protein
MRVIEGLTERSPNFDELHVLLNDSSMREHKHTPSCASQVHSIRVLLTVKRHEFIACPICGPERERERKLHPRSLLIRLMGRNSTRKI